MRRFLPLLIVLAAVLTFATPAALYLREMHVADRCAESGGSVDFETMACDRAGTAHPFIPFSSRHRGLIIGSGAVLGLLIVASAIAAGNHLKPRR